MFKILTVVLWFTLFATTAALLRMPTKHLSVRRKCLSMSTIAVFGGTGLTGRECVYQALNSGHKVLVLARDPTKMLIPKGTGGDRADQPLVNDNLIVLKGDVTNQADVDSVFDTAAVDSVIVTLGGKTKDVGPTMLSSGTSCIIDAMKRKSNAKRIAVLTAIGAGDSEHQAPLMFKALMYTVMKSIFAEKNKQESLFLNANGPGNDLDYCLVRPGGLGVGPPTGVVNVIDGKAGSIQRGDVASFLLAAVTEEAFPHLKQTPCISSNLGTSWRKEKGSKARAMGFDAATTA